MCLVLMSVICDITCNTTSIGLLAIYSHRYTLYFTELYSTVSRKSDWSCLVKEDQCEVTAGFSVTHRWWS